MGGRLFSYEYDKQQIKKLLKTKVDNSEWSHLNNFKSGRALNNRQF